MAVMRLGSLDPFASDGVAIEQVETRHCEDDEDDVEHRSGYLLELLRTQHRVREVHERKYRENQAEDLVKHAFSPPQAIVPQTPGVRHPSIGWSEWKASR
jgi:hypothetical protein